MAVAVLLLQEAAVELLLLLLPLATGKVEERGWAAQLPVFTRTLCMAPLNRRFQVPFSRRRRRCRCERKLLGRLRLSATRRSLAQGFLR